MAEWVQVLLAIATVAASAGVASFRSGAAVASMKGSMEANVTAIDNLTRALDGERAARAASYAELNNRIDRHGDRVRTVEEAHAAKESATALILGELKANLLALKESVDRLISAEAADRRAPPSNAIDQLRSLLELQKLLKQAA